MRLSRPFLISPNGDAKIGKEIETWEKTFTSIYPYYSFTGGGLGNASSVFDAAHRSRNRGEVCTFSKEGWPSNEPFGIDWER